MKRLIFVNQAKGGVGKSILTFMLAEKYPEAVILDLDDISSTTMRQLSYRNPTLVRFLDPATKRIDRNVFLALFESVSKSNHDLFVADLGASISDQLPKFFTLNKLAATVKLLHANNVHLQLVCVVGGANIFNATMTYLEELVESTKGEIEIVVAQNGMFPCVPSQQDQLVDYVNEKRIALVSFDLVEDKTERAMRNIENVLRDGQGLAQVDPFVSVYFEDSVKNLNL